MNEIEILQQQNHRTLVLVRVNFAMFLILFFGLGNLIWQSTTLISRLEQDLDKVQQAVVRFQDKIQRMDAETVMGKVMDKTKEAMGDSLKAAIHQSDFGSSLSNIANKVENTQEKIEQVRETIEVASEKLRTIDAEQLAQAVSYNILKNLGEGFTSAAENNKPSAVANDKANSPTTQ